MTCAVLIITTTKSSSWLNSNSGVSILCGITRPSQNDKNMPRVSGRATVATRPPFWNYFHPRLLTSRSQRFFNPVSRPITCSKRQGFFLFCFCFLSVFYKPIERTIIVHAGRRTDGLVSKRRPKSYWKTDTTTGTLHYLYLWVILDVTEYHIWHNYDIAQTFSMFYRHRSVLTLPALSKLVLRNWFLRKIPQKGHLYRDKWETSSEKRNTYQLDGKSYLSRVLLLQVDTNQWKSIIDFNQYYQ